MAAVQPLKYTGGAFGALDGAADDSRFNSLGIGAAATGTTGIVNFTVAARGPDGTLAAPAFAFTTEPNTGLRLAAAGDLRAVVAGADALTLSAAGLTIPGTLDLGNLLEMANVKGIRWGSTGGPLISGSNVDDTLIVETGTIERMRIDSTGLITIAGRITGVSAPTAETDAVRANELNGWLSNNSATPQGAADTVARFTWADGSGTLQTTEADFELRAPYACVIDNLHIDATSGPATAGLVFTLRNTGANTALTATVAAAATQASNTTNSATYVKGEKIAMQVQGATGITSFGSGYRFTMRVRRV